MRRVISIGVVLVALYSFAQEYESPIVYNQYLMQLGETTDYEQVRNLRQEVFCRNDITIEQKTQLSNLLTERYNDNLDKALVKHRNELIVRGVATIGLKTVGYTMTILSGGELSVPGSALVAWGDGILNEKTSERIAEDMAIAMALDWGIGKGIKWSGEKLKAIAENPKVKEATKDVVRVFREKTNQAAKKIAEIKIQKIPESEMRKYADMTLETMKKARNELQRKLKDVNLTKLERSEISAKIAQISNEIQRFKSKTPYSAYMDKLMDEAVDFLQKEIQTGTIPFNELFNKKVVSPLTDMTNDALLRDVYNDVMDSVAGVMADFSMEVSTVIGNVMKTQSDAFMAGYEYGSQIASEYGNDQVVLTGSVSENVYIDNSTGEIIQGHGDAPANILNATFADDPAEPKDAQTLANEAFDKEIDKIVKDVADGDESLAQKIKDFVKGKIDEAVKKGEEWIENGGIRKTILEQVDKMLEGKVSPADAQRIHNLVDTLCNVNKDGGESFLETLGTDGKDLAVSLAVEALKKQLADALPEDIADTVNILLDVFKEQGSADDYKKAALGKLQDLIANHVPYENTANTLNGILQSIADGNAIDVMDSIKDVGKNLGVDLLKDVISKNLDPELANRINALLDGFAQNGMQGVTDEALKQIYDLIDRCAPGADSAQKIKDIIKGTINGTVTAPDLRDAATSIVVDGAKKLINGSDLPQPIKDAANVAIDGLAENGITGLTENVGDYIQDYITDQLGEDAGNAAREIYDAVVTPGEDAWESIVTNAPTIGKAIGQKVLAWVEGKIAAQIDKLIGKYPELKNVLDRLGITGKGIVQGVKNVLNVLFNAKDLKDAMKQLSTMAVNFLKNALGKLIDIGLEYAFKWLASNLVPKVVDWATTKLQKWANSASNPLLKKGLQWLAGQVSNCKKCANAKIKISGIGDKVIKGVEKIIDGRKKGKVHIETK